MKKILTIMLAVTSFTACKKDDKGSSFSSAKVGDKVTGGWVIYKSSDGHGVILSDSFKNTSSNWYYAFEFCESLEHGGVTNWRLPTSVEFEYMWDNAYSKGIGNFSPDNVRYYWGCELPTNTTNSWVGIFSPNNVEISNAQKGAKYVYTRPVRDF